MDGFSVPDFDVVDPRLSGRGLYQSLGSQPSAGQPQAYQGSPLVAGLLGLPGGGTQTQGAVSGQAQPSGQPQQQPQPMSPLLAGIVGAPQPGSLAGAATGGPQGAQPQNANLGAGMGGLLRAMIYGGQSQDV